MPGEVSQRKGRAYWSKSVEIEDAPVFAGVTGPNLMKALREWMESGPSGRSRSPGSGAAGIEIRGGMVMELSRRGDLIELVTSVEKLKEGKPLTIERFLARAVVVASGFEDKWPDIEEDESAERLFQKYRAVFRYAGNAKGWHVCIRCDGHLHIDQHLAILGVGDYVYGTAFGAQDFTDKITILTNGRPHGMSPPCAPDPGAGHRDHRDKDQTPHRQGTDLIGLEFEDGTGVLFDGFLVDEGLEPNTQFLKGWDVQTDEEGLLVVDEDGQVLDTGGKSRSRALCRGRYRGRHP